MTVCVKGRQDFVFKVILGKVDHMTNCTWIGPAVIIHYFLQVILGTVSHVTVCVKGRQDIIFKVILGKVDHMTNCTWIGPAVIIRFFFASYSWYSGSVSRIPFLSHEKLVIKFTTSLRYCLVLEVLPTQFLVASSATVLSRKNCSKSGL